MSEIEEPCGVIPWQAKIVLVLSAAILMALLIGDAAKLYPEYIAAKNSSAQLGYFVIETEEVSKDDLQKVADRIGALHGSVDVKIKSVEQGSVLLVEAEDVGDYQLWRMAVNDVVMSTFYDWKTVSMCAGVKCPDSAYSIQMIAYERKVGR